MRPRWREACGTSWPRRPTPLRWARRRRPSPPGPGPIRATLGGAHVRALVALDRHRDARAAEHPRDAAASRSRPFARGDRVSPMTVTAAPARTAGTTAGARVDRPIRVLH